MKPSMNSLSFLIPFLLLASCSTLPSGSVYQTGLASWYGEKFHGKKTASGEKYNMHELTAAHPKLPFGSLVRVRSLSSGKSVTVRINDRGPFSSNRIIDLSYAAAASLGMISKGEDPVEIFLE